MCHKSLDDFLDVDLWRGISKYIWKRVMEISVVKAQIKEFRCEYILKGETFDLSA